MTPTDWIVLAFFLANALGAWLWYIVAGMGEDPPGPEIGPLRTTEGERRHGGPAPSLVYPVLYGEDHEL